MNLHKRPLFIIGVAYVGGILCAAQTDTRLILLLVLALCLPGIGMLLRSKQIHGPVVGILAAVFALGFMRTASWRDVPQGDVSGFAVDKLVYMTGVVASDLEPSGSGAKFVIKAREVKNYTGVYHCAGKIMVNLNRSQWGSSDEGTMPFYGETLRFHGRLSKPRPPSSAGSFDYGEYLSRKRVFCTLTAYTSEVTVLRPPAHGIRWMALRLKSVLTNQAGKLFPPVNAALMLGILLGNYAALPLAVQAAFMRSGTMHLLAASGYNCGVVVLILGFILRKLTVPRSVTHILLIASVWGFALVAGAGPSIVRASVMVTVFLCAYLIWRAPDTLNTICAAGLVILAVNPMDVFDIGFQLSFSAVFGIISIMPMVEPWIRRLFKVSARIWEREPSRFSVRLAGYSGDVVLAMALSAAAGLWTWPITAFYFNYLSLVSLIANAMVALLVVLITVVGMAALFLSMLWLPLGQSVGLLGTGLTEAVLRIVDGLGMQSWSSLSLRSPNLLIIAAYYIVLFWITDYAYRKLPRT